MADTEPSIASRECPDCHETMVVTRDVKFRVGGRKGSTVRWGEIFEDLLPFDLYYWAKCEQVRLYKPASLKPAKQKVEP